MARNPDPLKLNAPVVTAAGIPNRDFAMFLELVWRKIIVPVEEFVPDAATAYYNIVGEFTKGVRGSAVSVPYASSITLDLDDGNVFLIGALTGPLTLNNPSNMVAGQDILIVLRQDAVGTRAITLGSAFLTPGGEAPGFSTDASAIDILVGTVISETEIVCSHSGGFA